MSLLAVIDSQSVVTVEVERKDCANWNNELIEGRAAGVRHTSNTLLPDVTSELN